MFEVRSFNDVLALVLAVMILALWTLQGLGIVQLDGLEVIGATIAAFTLIVQYYFRKSPPAAGG